MIVRKFALALAAGAFLAGSALAQDRLVEVGDSVEVVPFGANADTVDDWDVFDTNGVEIGEVEDVVGTDASTPTALVVDFEGNAGYPDRDIVIPLDQFSFENNRLVLNADADAVRELPEWDD